MKLQRYGALAAASVAGVLALTGCGSDNNAGTEPAADSAATSVSCAAGTLNAEGSSAQKNAFEEVAAQYIELCDEATVNYNPTGSGAGIKQFNAGQVDFAGSDSALKEDEGEVAAARKRCQGNDAWNIPMVVGPIAIAYNLPGVDDLTLTPEVAAGIFNGTVTTWDDPVIAAINADVELPNSPIKVFFRSDESGTTENFTKYLAGAAAGTWTDEPAKIWSGAGEGREKSAGVAEGVKGTEGSITYVEWSYARDNDLAVAKVDNGAGATKLTAETVGTAVAAAEQTGQGNDLRLQLDYATKEPGAYPILLVTYEIVCSKGLPGDRTDLLKGFLGYFASQEGQAGLAEIGYAPLPAEVRTEVVAAIEAIEPGTAS